MLYICCDTFPLIKSVHVKMFKLLLEKFIWILLQQYTNSDSFSFITKLDMCVVYTRNLDRFKMQRLKPDLEKTTWTKVMFMHRNEQRSLILQFYWNLEVQVILSNRSSVKKVRNELSINDGLKVCVIFATKCLEIK